MRATPPPPQCATSATPGARSRSPRSTPSTSTTSPPPGPTCSSTRAISARWSGPRTPSPSASVPGADLDVITLVGVEPQLRWRTFCDQIIGVARCSTPRRVITFGALLAEVPHARPVSVFGVGYDDEVSRELDLLPSRYEGPTGITGVLQTACRDAGLGRVVAVGRRADLRPVGPVTQGRAGPGRAGQQHARRGDRQRRAARSPPVLRAPGERARRRRRGDLGLRRASSRSASTPTNRGFSPRTHLAGRRSRALPPRPSDLDHR